MSDAWDFYFARVNNAAATLFVDLGIRDLVPVRERPWLLWSWVYFRHPRDDGLSSSEEAAVLHQIEDALTHAVKATTGAELVGRITTAGRREFYFYGPRPDRFEETVASALNGFLDYRFDSGVKEDPGWTHYFNVLYPSPEEHQCIKNLHVVEVLEKQGDLLTTPRPVSHWAYFKSSRDRAKFIAKAADSGFKVIDEFETDDPDAGHAYAVVLERIDHVDWNSINDTTITLFRWAQEDGGDYDGWESPVQKDARGGTGGTP